MIHPITPSQAMKMALDLAKLGFGSVSPNPPVGCVVVDEHHLLISRGYHEKFGQAHAEINAIKCLKPEQLKGATLYVSLEPCSHEGKTSSCAKALAKLPIKKVVYGLVDPNPLVAGKGLEILKAAGIEVEPTQEWGDEAQELIEIFNHNILKKELFVALKFASSLDGQIALKDGTSKWITGVEARQDVHAVRAKYDAILIGANTLIRDNPSLDVRHGSYQNVNNTVVIVGGGEKIFEYLRTSKILSAHEPQKVIWFTEKRSQVYENAKFKIFYLEKSNGVFDTQKIKQLLYSEKIYSLLVEGGANTISRFLSQGTAQRIYAYVAPTILGQAGNIGWSRDFSISKLDQGLKLQQIRTERLGSDILITGRLS